MDDDEDFLASIREYLAGQMPSWHVETESDPEKALTRLSVAAFTAVVADYRMPRMDGVRFLERARGLDSECRLVLATARPSAALAQMNPGGDELFTVLMKPLATRPFVDRLKDIVEGSGAH